MKLTLLKRWRHEMALKLRVPVTTIEGRLYHSKTLKYPPVKRINQRVVYVIEE